MHTLHTLKYDIHQQMQPLDRWLLGCFCTTPVATMEHLASIPPMAYTLRRLSENYTACLRKLSSHSEVARRLPPDWDSHDYLTPQLVRPDQSKLTVIHRLASLSHPNSKFAIPYLTTPWEHPHPWGTRLQTCLPEPGASAPEKKARITLIKRKVVQASHAPQTMAVFTDGSKRIKKGCRKVGAGYSIVHRDTELTKGHRSLGPRSDIYNAEIFALALAATQAVRTAPPSVEKISFFSDNRAAITSILDLKPHPAQAASIIFRCAIDSFLEKDPSFSVDVTWVPGHAGIKGNERADNLANQAGSLVPMPFFNRTATWMRESSAKSSATQECSQAPSCL
ncbi:hypothetical protein FRC10_005060 [Ceratobasidium sp. 414]|nr:hypothetical protein FRC10_005060 [Ceratobasidium sp. 414]